MSWCSCPTARVRSGNSSSPAHHAPPARRARPATRHLGRRTLRLVRRPDVPTDATLPTLSHSHSHADARPVHSSVCAFDPIGIPPQCETLCAEADLEGFNACFDLVMSPPCRSRLCERWYVDMTMDCLKCVAVHVSGTELENFASIIDVYNSTCNNRSLVVSRRALEPEGTLQSSSGPPPRRQHVPAGPLVARLELTAVGRHIPERHVPEREHGEPHPADADTDAAGGAAAGERRAHRSVRLAGARCRDGAAAVAPHLTDLLPDARSRCLRVEVQAQVGQISALRTRAWAE